jgi:thiamine biosynthesis lipoprotein
MLGTISRFHPRFTALAAVLAALSGCAKSNTGNVGAGRALGAPAQPDHASIRFDFVREKMGGPFRVVVYSADRGAADRAADAAYARVDQLNAALSDYEPNSEISRLSQRTSTGPMSEPIAVGDDLWRVLERAQSIAEQSDGAFDVTVGPLVRLWHRARELRELPTPERLEKTRPSIGYRFVRLDPQKHTVQLLAPRMRLDVGGLALGYIADQAVAAAAAAGAPAALVDAGGEISVGDPPPGEDGWLVAIQSLKNPDELTGQHVRIRHACVTSSGDTRRFIEIGGVRYSHIIDPRTGLGLTRRIGATVVSTDGMIADALDTAVCVLGPEKGIDLIDKTPGAAGRITTIDGDAVKVFESKRFRQFLAESR